MRTEEGGFTLIEVIIVVAITGIIVGGIASVLGVTLSSYPANASRLTLSENAHLLSSWLLPDVLSAGPSDSNINTATTTMTGCKGGEAPGSSNTLQLTWTDFDTGARFAAAYRLEQGNSVLARYYCTNATKGVPLSQVAPTRVVVGRNIKKVTVDVPPSTGQVNVTVTSQLSTLDQYSFTVSASRRPTTIPIVIASFAIQSNGTNYINLSNYQAVLATGTQQPGGSVTLTLTDSAKKPKTVQVQVVADELGRWTTDSLTPKGINASSLGEGNVTLTATDSTGQISMVTATKDTIAPLPVVTGPPFTNNRPIDFSVDFAEPVSPTPAHSSVTVMAPQPGYNWQVNATDSTMKHFEVSVGGLRLDGSGDGFVKVTINPKATNDLAGNPSVGSNTASVWWDRGGPAGLSMQAQVQGQSQGNDSVSFSGTAGHAPSDNLVVTIVICVDNVFPCSSGTTLTTDVDPAKGTWGPVTANKLAGNRTYYAQLSQTDKLGYTNSMVIQFQT